MKAIIFITEIFKKFPFLLISNAILLLAVSLSGVCSLFTISPVVDLFIHPDLNGVSPLTIKAVHILGFFHLSPTLNNWLIIFLLFIVLNSAFYVFARYSIYKTRCAVLRDLILGTFDDFFNARWYFFSSSRQGTLLNTFTRELTVVGDAFGAMALFFANILQIILYLAVPFYLSWQVTIISLIVAFLFALPFYFLGKLSFRLGKLNTATANYMISVIQENLNLAKIVLGFGNQNKSIDNLRKAFDSHRNVMLKSQTLYVAMPRLYRPFGMLMIVIALFAARRFNVPISEIAVLIFTLFQVVESMGAIIEQKNALENFLPSYEQIKALRQRAIELKQQSGFKKFENFTQELVLENVSFAYPEHEPVLNDINIRIPKGKMFAFVGMSGSGKSTLIDIIMGFNPSLRGRVTLDGVGLHELDINSYRHRLGYVPQESVLFNMSIRDNLRWAKEDASEKEIEEACTQANADEFIRALPQGYNTLVGDRGVRLSGGQVQRIALARAILRKPLILILDEATSSVDTYSERLIQEAIENIAKETTVIVIAHRLSTVINADYVYVLGDGRILEQGTYSYLIEKNGEFCNMVKLQILGTDK